MTEQTAPVDGQTEDNTAQEPQSQETDGGKISKRTLSKIEGSLRLPGALVVAGDATEAGARYAGTAFDDGRQSIPWGDGHETILRGMLATASHVKNPADDAPPRSKIAYSPESPVSVYVIGTDSDHDLVVENGRQRRRAAAELNRRVSLIAEWCAAHPEVKSHAGRRSGALKDFAAQRIDAENRPCRFAGLLPGGKTATVAYDDGTTAEVPADSIEAVHPWAENDFFRLVFGTDEFGEASDRPWIKVHKGEGDAPPSFEPVLMHLLVVVAGVNPKADMHLLASMTARQEGTIPTPLRVKARIFERLTAPGPDGKPAMTRDQAGKRLGTSGDTVTNYLKFLTLAPVVQDAVESGRVTLAIVVSGGGKAGCMFVKGEGKGDYVALPVETQIQIWDALCDRFPPDENGVYPEIRGDKAKQIALKIQKAILSGKDPAAETPEEPTQTPTQSNTEDTAESTPTQTQDGGEKTKPTPPKAKRGKLDLSRYDEHLSRAEGSLLDPDENGLRDADIRERVETAASVRTAKAVVRFLSGDRSALSGLPAVLRDALIAATADDEPTVAPASSEDAARELAYNAVIGWSASGGDESAVLDHTDDEGAKAILTGWLEKARETGADLMAVASEAAA